MKWQLNSDRKKPLRGWLFVGISLFSIVVPGLMFFSPQTKVSLTEQRTLAAFPEWPKTVDELETFPEAINRWVDDHLPWKDTLVQANSFINYALLKTTASEQVILGHDGWLFYNNNQAMFNYRGTDWFSDEEYSKIRAGIESDQKWLAEKDIELILFMAPDKEVIEWQYMPSTILRISLKDRTDDLVERLQDDLSMKCVYPKQELLKYSDQYDLYYKYDTHWNQLGGFIGVQELRKTLGLQAVDLNEMQVNANPLKNKYHVSAKDDLAKMMNLREILLNDDTEYTITQLPVINWEEFDKDEDFLSLHNENADSHEAVIVVGDSFRVAMMAALSQSFENVYIIERDHYEPEMIDGLKAKYLVEEWVNRNVAMLGDLSEFKLRSE